MSLYRMASQKTVRVWLSPQGSVSHRCSRNAAAAVQIPGCSCFSSDCITSDSQGILIHAACSLILSYRKYIHVRTCTYIHTYIPTYPHTYMHTYMCILVHTRIHAYTHTHIHTYIHTYIHKYIHTYIQTYRHTQHRWHSHVYILRACI